MILRRERPAMTLQTYPPQEEVAMTLQTCHLQGNTQGRHKVKVSEEKLWCLSALGKVILIKHQQQQKKTLKQQPEDLPTSVYSISQHLLMDMYLIPV